VSDSTAVPKEVSDAPDLVPENVERTPSFEQELESLINKHSEENGSNTPDFILARYMMNCLTSFNVATNARTQWYKK
jgi:hypothetical protein